MDQAGNDVFLPADSEVAQASATVAESFPDSVGLRSITILYRGEFLSPDGLGQIDDVIGVALARSGVQERLALTGPVVSVVGVFKQALGVDDFEGVTQAEIDAAASEPQQRQLLTTAGDGDFSPTTTPGKVFTMMYVLVGIGILVALVTEIGAHLIAARNAGSVHRAITPTATDEVTPRAWRRGRPPFPQE